MENDWEVQPSSKAITAAQSNEESSSVVTTLTV